MTTYRTFDSVKRYNGLRNQGATCYQNSVLQVLFMTKDFREAVKRSWGYGEIDFELKMLFEELEVKETDTWHITRRLGISSVTVQGDAAEFFEKVLTNVKTKEASQLFEGKLAHKSVCAGCKEETSTVEPFWHLALELVGGEDEVFHVVDGINKYFSQSLVTGQDQMYCETCRAKADATIHFELQHHPEVLTLLLKRFEFDYGTMKYKKVTCGVTVSYRLTVEGQKYELYASVEHSGTLARGHYTVTIKSSEDQKWYRFNDSYVSSLTRQPFQGGNTERLWGAYLLFYRKEKDNQSGVNGEVATSAPYGPSGTVAKMGDGEWTVATADVKRVGGEEEKGVPDVEERERPGLPKYEDTREEKGKPASAAEGRSSRVGELRAESKSPTGVKVETASRDAPAGTKPAEPKKPLYTMYNLVCPSYGPNAMSHSKHEDPIATRKLKSNKQKEDDDDDEKAEAKDGHYRADKFLVIESCRNDGRSDDIEKRSGEKSVAEEQVRRDPPQGGGGENHLHKPNYQKVCGVASYRSDLGWNEDRKEELMEVQTGDEAPSGPESVCGRQSAEGQDDGQSEGDQPERWQEDLRGATRGEDSEERRENAQGESGAAGERNAPAGVQDNVMSEGSVVRRGRTTQEETGGQKRSERREERGAGVRQATDEVASLSEIFQTMNVTDSASTGTENTTWSTSGARGSRHGSQSLPALGIGQQPQWVLNLPPTQHLSPGGIIPQQPPIVTQGHIPCVTGVPPMLVQPTGPPGLPPPYSNGPESYQVVSMAPPQHLSPGYVIIHETPIVTQGCIPCITGVPPILVETPGPPGLPPSYPNVAESDQVVTYVIHHLVPCRRIADQS